MTVDVPEGLTFEAVNDMLDESKARWTKVRADYPCSECRARGGWMPVIDQSNCPNCWGEDPYGQSSYCGECEWCCGC